MSQNDQANFQASSPAGGAGTAADTYMSPISDDDAALAPPQLLAGDRRLSEHGSVSVANANSDPTADISLKGSADPSLKPHLGAEDEQEATDEKKNKDKPW